MRSEDSRFVAFEVTVAPGVVVSARHYAPAPERSLGTTLVLAHGAGAGQTSPFMVDYATGLCRRGVDIVTFNFPYMEARRRLPDPNARLEATWCAVLQALGSAVRPPAGAPRLAPDQRLLVGGKSMGGRIASQVAAQPEHYPATIAGLIFFGYPLHPPGKPAERRDRHLPAIRQPMLFVQGERDIFGSAEEMRALASRLPGAELYIVTGANHSLEVPKRAQPRRPSHDEVQDYVIRWIATVQP